MWIYIASDRKSPEKLPPTDADRIYLNKTSSFGGGSYKVSGDKVIANYAASSNQTWTGTERTWMVQVSGKMLATTSAPFKTTDGKEVVAIATFERLE